jgi:hypothetical protein
LQKLLKWGRDGSRLIRNIALGYHFHVINSGCSVVKWELVESHWVNCYS